MRVSVSSVPGLFSRKPCMKRKLSKFSGYQFFAPKDTFQIYMAVLLLCCLARSSMINNYLLQIRSIFGFLPGEVQLISTWFFPVFQLSNTVSCEFKISTFYLRDMTLRRNGCRMSWFLLSPHILRCSTFISSSTLLFFGVLLPKSLPLRLLFSLFLKSNYKSMIDSHPSIASAMRVGCFGHPNSAIQICAKP